MDPQRPRRRNNHCHPHGRRNSPDQPSGIPRIPPRRVQCQRPLRRQCPAAAQRHLVGHRRDSGTLQQLHRMARTDPHDLIRPHGPDRPDHRHHPRQAAAAVHLHRDSRQRRHSCRSALNPE